MLERIKRAVMFKTDVYPEVSQDVAFTKSAWLILVVSYALFALGATSSFLWLGLGGVFVLSFLLQAALGVGGFVLGVFVLTWVAKPLFQIELKFDQLFRPLALASVFLAAGLLGLIPVIGGLFIFAAAAGAFVAMLFALKTLTGLDWGRVVVLVIIMGAVVGIVMGIVSAITGAIYGGILARSILNGVLR
jgi:hypothetical protein